MDTINSEIISNFEWLSSAYSHIDRIKSAHGLFIFVNQSESAKPFIIIKEQKIYIPDSAVYIIKKHSQNSPLKFLWEESPFDKTNKFSFGDDDPNAIIICMILLISGDMLAFSFIDPYYIPAVYKFIDKYIPELESYLSVIINRIINAVLYSINEHFLKADAIKVLLQIYEVIPAKRYYNLQKAYGYAIWSRPLLACDVLGEVEFPLQDGNCYKNVMWSDVLATILSIKYSPREEIEKLDKYRMSIYL